jgi:replication initiation and membrane attachment protein
MRVSNLFEFTETHRFFATRHFALSGLDRTVLASLYQPMVGAAAAGFYHYLYHLIGESETGCTALEQQRKLFLGLGLEPNPAGRKALIEASSCLEAVGLLQVFRHFDPAAEETVYEYVLHRPLSAAEFFANHHLVLLLRDKIGKAAVLELRGKFAPSPPEELARFVEREEITVPFYELFRIGASLVDPDLESGWPELAPARELPQFPERIRHADMLLRFPRGSANRRFVEMLGKAAESMAQINHIAYKYDLDVPEICRLLDEDGIFRADGTLNWDELNHRANSVYHQFRKREEEAERFLSRKNRHTGQQPEALPDVYRGPLLDVPEKFSGMTPEAYMLFLMRQPYTRVLEKHFPGAVPDSILRIFDKIDINYKLPEPVINVLIHYVYALAMKPAERISASFIDAIATNMLLKNIMTFEEAVSYILEQQKRNEDKERRRRGGEEKSPAQGARSRTQARRKPAISVVEDKAPPKPISPEEREKMRELVRKLKEDS